MERELDADHFSLARLPVQRPAAAKIRGIPKPPPDQRTTSYEGLSKMPDFTFRPVHAEHGNRSWDRRDRALERPALGRTIRQVHPPPTLPHTPFRTSSKQPLKAKPLAARKPPSPVRDRYKNGLSIYAFVTKHPAGYCRTCRNARKEFQGEDFYSSGSR